MGSSLFSRSLKLLGQNASTSDSDPKATIEEEKKEFDQIDENHDGKLSLDELIHAFENRYDRQQIISIFGDLDVDGDGTIDFDEFHAALQQAENAEKEVGGAEPEPLAQEKAPV